MEDRSLEPNNRKSRLISAIYALAAFSMASAAISAPAPNPSYCEANLAAANRAADAAVVSHRDQRKAALGVSSGAGCAALSLLFLGLDAGLTGIACGVIAAGVYVGSTPRESGTLASEAFRSVRDLKCLTR